MVDFPDTMVDLPDTMVDLPDTMVGLPNTIVNLPDSIVDLPDTMVDLPDEMIDLPDRGGTQTKTKSLQPDFTVAICIHEENTFYWDQKSVLTPNTEHIFKIGIQANFTHFKGIRQPVADFSA